MLYSAMGPKLVHALFHALLLSVIIWVFCIVWFDFITWKISVAFRGNIYFFKINLI